jgi:outer membrane lipoprotein carrier protein
MSPLLACLVLAAATTPPPVDPAVAPVVKKMQEFYERTKGFDTRFEQRVIAAEGVPSRLTKPASGRIRFRKPAGATGPMMRWDYEGGAITLLVGNRAFYYDPDTKQATEYPLDVANLSAAVTFMWGKGRLADEFVISPATRADLAGDGVALELTPRKPSGGFQRVFLVVDPATGIVRRSVVVQADGGENRLSFLEPKLDAAVTPGDFDPARAFPAGTAVTKAALPGAK